MPARRVGDAALRRAWTGSVSMRREVAGGGRSVKRRCDQLSRTASYVQKYVQYAHILDVSMRHVTFTDLRNNLATHLDRVEDDRDELDRHAPEP